MQRKTAGTRGLENGIDNWDRKSGGYCDKLTASAGSYTKRSCKGMKAKASTFEAGAHVSILEAKLCGPQAEAGVHTGVSGAKAFANATVVRAEATAGPVTVGAGLRATNGVHAGPGGYGVSILGFGASVGWGSIAFRTPVFDVSIGI